MNISLPEAMKAFVDAQVDSGRYSSASEYIRELIRGDTTRQEQHALESMLLKGLRGLPTPLTAKDMQLVRREAVAKLKARISA